MADAKERVRRLFEEPWKGNWDVLDEVVAPDYLGYDSGQAEPLRGIESLRGYLKAYSDAFPDARLTVHEQVAEPGKVADRLGMLVQLGAVPTATEA